MSERSQPIVISPQEYKSSQIAESKRQAAENRLDEGIEGGRYIVGDQVVNANGEPIKGLSVKDGMIVGEAKASAKTEH